MKTEPLIICNGCGWSGMEYELSLVEYDVHDETETPTASETFMEGVRRYADEPTERDFLKGCPNCLTDAYLTEKTEGFFKRLSQLLDRCLPNRKNRGISK